MCVCVCVCVCAKGGGGSVGRGGVWGVGGGECVCVCGGGGGDGERHLATLMSVVEGEMSHGWLYQVSHDSVVWWCRVDYETSGGTCVM